MHVSVFVVFTKSHRTTAHPRCNFVLSGEYNKNAGHNVLGRLNPHKLFCEL